MNQKVNLDLHQKKKITKKIKKTETQNIKK